MPCNSEDILDSNSEHNNQMDVNVLPTFEPQTPGPAQIQYYSTIRVTMWGLETAILPCYDGGHKILGLCLSENSNIDGKRMSQV